MRRRQFVKAMVAVTVSARSMLGQSQTGAAPVPPSTAPPTPPGAAPPPAPGPVPWMRGLMEAPPLSITTLVPDAVASTTTLFFTNAQMAALRQLCEVLLPPMNGHPGALDASAPEFLDFLISVSPADRQQMYRDGLNRLNDEARSKFGIPFSAVNATQADALIGPWLKAWMNDHPPQEPYERFISLAHADIRTATINSQAWSEAEVNAGKRKPGVGLYWFPVEADVEKKYLPRV
jgi:hypothetical protein